MTQPSSPFITAGEHLCDFVDKLLEAFHTGTGIRNNSPEPMTLDVVRRIIWSEIRRTLRNLAEDENLLAEIPAGLWMRVEGPSTQDILAAFGELGNHRTWTLRGFGPREADHPTIVYATVYPVEDPMEVRGILAQFASHGLAVRDFTLGPFPY